MLKAKATIVSIAIMVLGQFALCHAEPIRSAFTYQGSLKENSQRVSGNFDFEFSLYDDPCSGSLIAVSVPLNGVNVQNGLFSVELDFGDAALNGQERWIEVAVKGPEDTGFTTMPRQRVIPSPHTLYAKVAGKVSGGISGSGTASYIPKFLDPNTLEDSVIFESLGNIGIGITSPTTKLQVDGTVKATTFEGDGSGLTNLNPPVTVGTVPIGGVVAWMKSFPNTPTLADNFVECNGQTVNDPDSPYNNQTTPNLNGVSGETRRFLRGATASGATGGEDTHTLTIDEMPSHSHDIILCIEGTGPAGQSYNVNKSPATTLPEESGHITPTGGDVPHENRPPYYEVVWIMRVK